MLLIALLAIPIITAVMIWTVKKLRWIELINAAGAALMFGSGALVVVSVSRDGPREALDGLLYVDALSALMIALVSGIGFAAALVSIRYLRHDLQRRHVPDGLRGVRWYYTGIHAFIASMLATVCFDNLGLLWVGIEATTLASALLVGFYRTESALEAAWKYVVLCTVGITFALFGVILTYYASLQLSTPGGAGLGWTSLLSQAENLDPAMMRLAFVFVLVGFGTKAGFAPLHTWLADAHSQSPSPVSGLLSGVLLSCALYGILRFHALTAAATGDSFSSNLLLGFGVLSVAIAVPFILVQRDLKRLLAYSSVEHIGLMAVAFGIGGRLGIYAGLLHMVNHAVTKALLFFIAGDIVQRFDTRRLSAIRGVAQAAPFAGWLLLIGVLAIAGLPPFGVFISEIAIATAGFSGTTPAVVATTIVVLLLGVIFAGLLAHSLRLIYGAAPSRLTRETAPGQRRSSGPRLAMLVGITPLAMLVLLFGLFVPDQMSDLIHDVTTLIEPAPRIGSR